MQRDRNSNRTKKWMFRNLLKNQDCLNCVTNLCKSFGIEKYCIDDFKDNEPALFIQIKDGTVILAIDLENICLQSYRRCFKSTSEYVDIPKVKFENDSCWKQGIEWASKNV